MRGSRCGRATSASLQCGMFYHLYVKTYVGGRLSAAELQRCDPTVKRSRAPLRHMILFSVNSPQMHHAVKRSSSHLHRMISFSVPHLKLLILASTKKMKHESAGKMSSLPPLPFLFRSPQQLQGI